MNIKKINELHQQADQKMNAGDFEGALNVAYRIKSLGSHYFVSYTASGLLIDVGLAMGDENITKEGIDLLEDNFEKIVGDERFAQTAYYNLANGYSALFSFKRIVDPYASFFKKTELEKAKAYYRKALEYDLKDAMLASEIWVNLGNCFEHLGRVIDGLECYEEALKWKSDHGMALANKGEALFYYAKLTDEHQGTFLIEAYSLLSKALKLGVIPEALSTYSNYLETIRKFFKDKQLLDNPPQYPGCKIRARSKFERFLIEFCLEQKLYINICNFCQRCDAAIGDKEVIKRMIVRNKKGKTKNIVRDNSYLRLSSYLNQIKQDYITARFLIILSNYKGLNLNFVDKRVKIIDTLDYSLHNIYIQLMKASFKNFYDILDKIAFFINDYLSLGIQDTEINFQRIWYSNKENKMIRSKIMDTKNFSLYALFDIHRDFEKGPYKKLRKTRNALTHRFINIKMFQNLEDEENMTEETLLIQTLELARIVRTAIIYLLFFVHFEENKKEPKSKEIMVPIFARELPDKLKSYR